MDFSSLQDLFDYARRDRYAVTDAEWEEEKHPRDDNEQFASGKGKSNSTKNAEKLSLDMWGNTAEVIKQAAPIRSANSFSEARNILKNIVGKELKSKSGLPGNVSNKSVEKFLSGKAVATSFDLKAHLTAAANIDQLYKNSIEPFGAEKDKNNSPDLKAIHRTYAPMLLSENGEKRIIPVKFTVKEYTDKNTRNKLYSIEAIDFDLNEKKGTSILADDNQMSPNPGCSLFYFTIHDKAPKVKSLSGLWQIIKGE